jgi:hypothetical protein
MAKIDWKVLVAHASKISNGPTAGRLHSQLESTSAAIPRTRCRKGGEQRNWLARQVTSIGLGRMRNIPPETDCRGERLISHIARTIMTSAIKVARSRPRVVAPPPELKPNRRAFLALSAGSIALMATTEASCLAASDPILPMIEIHRAAATSVNELVRVQGELERLLPDNRRKSHVDAYEETIVATDDPRWVESERAVMAAFDAERDAARALLNVVPTTPAGVIALLQHVVSSDCDGERWGNVECNGKALTWHSLLIASLVEILPAMLG